MGCRMDVVLAGRKIVLISSCISIRAFGWLSAVTFVNSFSWIFWITWSPVSAPAASLMLFILVTTFFLQPHEPTASLSSQLFSCGFLTFLTSPVAQMVKRLPAMWEIRVRLLIREDPLEKEMATHSSTLAWKIPWTQEPGRLQIVGHNWVASLSLFTFIFLGLHRIEGSECLALA